MDLDQEGFDTLWNLLGSLETEWAQGIREMLSADAMQDAVKFWAVDPKPAGAGFASLNVTSASNPFPVTADALSTQLKSLFEQMGVEVVAVEPGLEINGLDAARLTLRLQTGPVMIKEHQYVYARGLTFWSLTLAVDETVWSAYESVFTMAAETFRLD